MIQIDGSHHDWFEGRAPKCCLLVFIDDATGKLQHLRFCESESNFDYMLSTRAYIEQQNQRNRSQKMPSRRAQKTAIQQRNLNPALDLEMSI